MVLDDLPVAPKSPSASSGCTSPSVHTPTSSPPKGQSSPKQASGQGTPTKGTSTKATPTKVTPTKATKVPVPVVPALQGQLGDKAQAHDNNKNNEVLKKTPERVAVLTSPATAMAVAIPLSVKPKTPTKLPKQ